MKRISFVIIAVIAMLILAGLPALADLTGSVDYTAGRLNGSSAPDPSADLNGISLGLRYDYNPFVFGLDYTGASSSFNSVDYWAGYRFYTDDTLSALAYLNFTNQTAVNNFNGQGFTLGIGAQYKIDGTWSLEGRIGYSLLGGATSTGLSNPSLSTFALKVNYQLFEDWSLHAGYRHYDFSGSNNTNLYTFGVTYRFPINTPGNSTASAATKSEPTLPSKSGALETAVAPSALQSDLAAQSGTAPQAQKAPLPGDSVLTPAQTAETDAAMATLQSEMANTGAKLNLELLNNSFQPVFFDFDKSNIRPNQVAVMKKNLEILKANPDLAVQIGGHADQKGASAYNLKLSEKRAQAVKGWLVAQGIDPARIAIVSYGSKSPHATATGQFWESDRWVQIAVSGELKPAVKTVPADQLEKVSNPEPGVTPEAPAVTPATAPGSIAAAKTEPGQPNKMLQPVFFDFNKANLRPDQIAVLQKNLEILKETPDLYILVGGHADQKGALAYNLQLSEKRALAVKQWLIGQGINPARINIVAYGAKYPHGTTAGQIWESDRWVDIVVSNEPLTASAGIRK